MPMPITHCINGTAHCDCPSGVSAQICCFCRQVLPPRLGHNPYADMAIRSPLDVKSPLTESLLHKYVDKYVVTAEETSMNKYAKKSPNRAKETDMSMLAALKSYDSETTTLDEMVSLLACGDLITKTYETNDLEIPGWVVETVASLRTRIAALATDNREKALREIDQELERLKSTSEKKADLETRKAALKTKLGKA